MKLELQEMLYTEFPRIFRQKDLSCRETCMCWGIECPDSWFDILHTLCWEIQRLVDIEKSPQIEATQVKEKFGTLRFYYEGGNDKVIEKVDELISIAEDMTSKVCAICGSDKEVKQSKSAWVHFTCPKCEKRDE